MRAVLLVAVRRSGRRLLGHRRGSGARREPLSGGLRRRDPRARRQGSSAGNRSRASVSTTRFGLTLAADLAIVLCVVFGVVTMRTVRQRARGTESCSIWSHYESPDYPGTEVPGRPEGCRLLPSGVTPQNRAERGTHGRCSTGRDVGGDPPRTGPRARAPRPGDVPNAQLATAVRLDALREVRTDEHLPAPRDGGGRLLFATVREAPPCCRSRRNVRHRVGTQLRPCGHGIRRRPAGHPIAEQETDIEGNCWTCGWPRSRSRHVASLCRTRCVKMWRARSRALYPRRPNPLASSRSP